MGNVQSDRANRLSTASEPGTNKKKPALREHKRHGFVAVKVHSNNPNRRPNEGVVNHIISPKGSILYGSLHSPTQIVKAIEQSQFPILPPSDIVVPDSRAHKLFITYCHGWQLIPFPEVFSRHSGTCLVVGDRNNPSMPFSIKIGDCFRLGSVGLVVSELKVEGEEEQRIDAKTLQFLKDEALAFDTNEDLAALASDEMLQEAEDDCRDSVHGKDTNKDKGDTATVKGEGEEDAYNGGGGLTNGEKYICYMCYETHNTAEDPLVAPCECRGDTRFLHVHCLQKWYQSSAFGSFAQVIRTTGSGAPACKICGTAYKTNFRRADGKKANILEFENDGPYLSLVVVTHHDTNPGLFNTKFRLNFGRRANVAVPANITDNDLNTIVIGRSSSCAMILDYRTVSTIHAKITYSNGRFYLSDNRSSNGTMVYIRDPLPLSYTVPMKIRMGRTTISLQAKRSWTAAMRSFLFGDNVPPVNPDEPAQGANRASMVRDTVDSGVSGGGLDSNFPYPNDILLLLQTIHQSLLDKAEEHEGGGQEPNHLMNRSYTIRTVNDNGSLDGRGLAAGAALRESMAMPAGPSGELFGMENEAAADPVRASTSFDAHSGRRVSAMSHSVGGSLFDALHEIPEDAVLPPYFTPHLLQAAAVPSPSADTTFVMSPGAGVASPVRGSSVEDNVINEVEAIKPASPQPSRPYSGASSSRPTTPRNGLSVLTHQNTYPWQQGTDEEGNKISCSLEEGEELEEHLTVKITPTISTATGIRRAPASPTNALQNMHAAGGSIGSNTVQNVGTIVVPAQYQSVEDSAFTLDTQAPHQAYETGSNAASNQYQRATTPRNISTPNNNITLGNSNSIVLLSHDGHGHFPDAVSLSNDVSGLLAPPTAGVFGMPAKTHSSRGQLHSASPSPVDPSQNQHNTFSTNNSNNNSRSGSSHSARHRPVLTAAVSKPSEVEEVEE